MIEIRPTRLREFEGPKHNEDVIFPVFQKSFDYNTNSLQYTILLNGLEWISDISVENNGDLTVEWKTPLYAEELRIHQKQLFNTLFNRLNQHNSTDALFHPDQFLTLAHPSSIDHNLHATLKLPSQSVDFLEKNLAFLEELSCFIATTETTIPKRRIQKILSGILMDRKHLKENPTYFQL